MSIIVIGHKDYPENPNTLIIAPDDSHTIDSVRNILHFVSLGKDKTVVIRNAERLTEEAQNALLKTLEEPPNGATIILETTDETLLLPTICSRCTIEFGSSEKILPNPELYSKIAASTVPEKLELAKTLATKRPEAENLINSLLVASQKEINPQTIRALFRAKKLLKANVNPRLVMENLFLNW